MISLISHVLCDAVQIFQIITQEEFKQSVVFSYSALKSYLKLKKISKQTKDPHGTPHTPPKCLTDVISSTRCTCSRF